MMTRLVGAVLLLVSCAVAKAAAPSGPGGVRIAEVLAPGDTLAYTVSWTAGARATNYDFVTAVSATNGAWTVLYGTTNAGAPPASGTTTGLSFGLKLTAIPWDSATFTVSVTARNAAGSSAPMVATWSVKRKPGPPGLPKVDSALTITGLRVEPHTVQVLTSGTVQFCAFIKFVGGQIVNPERPPSPCDSLYAANVPAVAKWGITAAQQAVAESTCVTWAATGGTITNVPCPLGLRDGLRFQVALGR